MRNIILFELNEVPFKVIDYYCDKYPNSVLAKTLSKSYQFETRTEDQGHLHPWSTWPTIHRGITNELHGIKDFGEDLTQVNENYPSIWELLMDKNISAGVCASFHSYPVPENYKAYKFFIPDPFSPKPLVHPAYITGFQKFNLEMARRSVRNVDTSIDKGAALKLGMSFPKLGITLQTVKNLMKQILSERKNPWKGTRRRTFQSVLAFDVYYKLLKKEKPQFSTFLSNHVASAMPRYWAATFPKDYKENNLSEEWINRYSGEIDFALDQFDKFLSKLVSFANKNPNYKLVVLSSMGQQATSAEPMANELLVDNFDTLLQSLGMQEGDYSILPAMHPQYNLKVSNGLEDKFISALQRLTVKGSHINYRQKDNGFFSLDFGNPNLSDDSICVNDKVVLPNDIGLVNQPADEEASGTAYHIREGSMFIYDPQNPQSNHKRIHRVDTTRIAPSILKNFKVAQPDYMNKELIAELCD
jgi:hypothetical protein